MWCWSREVWIEMTITPVDILALADHRDDVEQTCGGTLLKMAQRGHRTGILDLTKGEMGTRGTAEDRARGAAETAKLLRVSCRSSLNVPDGRVENTSENRLEVARVVRPTFVVDITDQFEARLQSLVAYKSQFADQEAGSDIFPAAAEIRSRIESMARFYGMLGGVTYAEPFLQKEVGLVDDLLAIPV